MAGTTPKFNLTRLLNERSREAAVQENKEEKTAEIATPEDGVSSTADIYDLIPSKGNFYSVKDVQDLKQSIELLGVLQPLLVTDEEEDGKHRIIAGHRRRLAVMPCGHAAGGRGKRAFQTCSNLNQAKEKRYSGQTGTDYGKPLP